MIINYTTPTSDNKASEFAHSSRVVVYKKKLENAAEHFYVLVLAVRLYKLAVMHVVHAESLRVQSISLIQNKALPLHQYLKLAFFSLNH